MHGRTARVLRRVFVLLFVLLLVLFAQALVRTNFIAARAPSAARIGMPAAATRQVVRRIRTAPTSPNGRVVIFDGVKFPWTDSGFSAALIAAGSNATLLIPQNAMITLTSDHMLAFDDLTVRCEPGAEFVSGVDEVSLITITGRADAILGCEFSGGSFPDSNPLFLWNSRDAHVEDNIASGFVGISTAFVYLVGAESSVISGNQCTVARGGASCIFGEKNALSTTVQDNELDESVGGVDAHDITFHSTNPGTSVSGTQILNNRMLGGRGFCVEIGAFGGEPAEGFVISGNTCKMNGRGLGGYSVGSAATFWSVANNTFDANGFVPQISCLEVAGASDGILLGNSCNGGNISLSNSEAQRVTITSNVVYNFRPIANAGIYVGTAITSGQMNDNLVTSNLIHLPSGVATIGIWQQCLAPEAICDRNTYDHNTIVSDGTPGTVGIMFENDRGTSADETLGSNSFRTPHELVVTQGLVTFTSNTSASPAAALPASGYLQFPPQAVSNGAASSR